MFGYACILHRYLMNDSIERSWKDDFYARYSTFFGRKITEGTYDHFIPYGRHIVRKLFPADKSSRILDMGCGIGGFIKVFIDEGYHQVQGIDLSKEDVDYAHANGIHQVKQGELWEILKTAPDGSYDVILYLDVLEHFGHAEILSILRETYRILAPQGRIIIHCPNAEGIFGSRIRYADFTHELSFTSDSLAQITRYAGFDSFVCYEDKPIAHGVVSFFRRILWEILTLHHRVLFAAETGKYIARLSQNILFCAVKNGTL